MKFMILTPDLKSVNPGINLRTSDGFAFLLQAEMASVVTTFKIKDCAWPHGILVADADPDGKPLLEPEVYLFPLSIPNDKGKEAQIEQIKEYAQRMRAFGLILTFEVWARFMSKEELENEGIKSRPSEDPQRKELVVCSGEFTPEGLRAFWMTEIATTDDGGKQLGRWEPMDGTIAGQFSQLLPAYMPPTLN